MDNKIILVADDNEPIRSVMTDVITRRFNTISVECAQSGEEAIEKVKNKSYDLIFLDINFGDGAMSGIEALKKIKEIRQDQKVYLMTGYGVSKAIQKIAEEECLGLLQKPFKLDNLWGMIERGILVPYE